MKVGPPWTNIDLSILCFEEIALKDFHNSDQPGYFSYYSIWIFVWKDKSL